MRIKKYEGQQFICFRIDEAKKLKEYLDDYAYICENLSGYAETTCEEITEFTNQVDEAIMKAESM